MRRQFYRVFVWFNCFKSGRIFIVSELRNGWPSVSHNEQIDRSSSWYDHGRSPFEIANNLEISMDSVHTILRENSETYRMAIEIVHKWLSNGTAPF